MNIRQIIATAVCSIGLLCSANALEFEGGIGVANTQPQPNGTWYQEGFPYSMDLTKKAFYIGVKEKIAPNASVHLDYVNFGVLHVDAIATPVDSNYNPANRPPCNGPCIAESRFVSSGRSDAIKLAVNWSPWSENQEGFGVITGAILFNQGWGTTVYNWKQSKDSPGITIQNYISRRWTLRPVIGVAYKKDQWEVRLEQYFNKPYSSVNTGIAKSTTMLSVGYSF